MYDMEKIKDIYFFHSNVKLYVPQNERAEQINGDVFVFQVFLSVADEKCHDMSLEMNEVSKVNTDTVRAGECF